MVKGSRARCHLRKSTERSGLFSESDAHLQLLVILVSFRRRREGDADPVLLDPGNPALTDRAILGHHQPKLRRHKRHVFDFDSRTLSRGIAPPPAPRLTPPIPKRP